MNRAEFMSRLTALLQDVPPAEREEAITYYNEYFDDAGEGNEAGVIAALGSPEELAKAIKAGLFDGGNGGEFTESGFHGYEQRNKNQLMSTNEPQSGAQGSGGAYQNVAVFQLLQRHVVITVALLGSIGVVFSNSNISDDSENICAQRIGPLWRYGIPCREVRVVHAFLRVEVTLQNVSCDPVTDGSIFGR